MDLNVWCCQITLIKKLEFSRFVCLDDEHLALTLLSMPAYQLIVQAYGNVSLVPGVQNLHQLEHKILNMQ